MTIKTITASESIETMQPNGLRKWKKTKWDAELSEGEDPEEATKELHKRVEVLNEGIVVSVRFSISEPPYQTQQPLPEIQVDKGSGSVDGLIKDIENCPNIENLNQYRWVKGSDPRITEAFDKRLKELS